MNPTRILLSALAALLAIFTAIVFTSCAGVPVELAYINEDVAGHSLAASVTLGGKTPKAALALTKRNSGLLADSGK